MHLHARTFLATTAVTAALVTSAVGAAPASAAPPTKPKVVTSTTCGEPVKLYSKDRWTYSETKACLVTDGAVVWPELKVVACQYYWGGAWYSASDKHPCKFTINYTVSHDGVTPVSGSSQGNTPSSGTVTGKSGRCAGNGTYALDISFSQDGPYWYNWEINSGPKTYQLGVLCGK